MRQVLVEWLGESPALATWEDLDDLRARFPSFQLEDELDFEAGEMSCTVVHTPRRRARDVRRSEERVARALDAHGEAQDQSTTGG